MLHPFQLAAGSPHAGGSEAMFDRGHIDHFALNVTNAEDFEELRHRLVEAGATDGAVTDFGIARNVWFHDPGGMGCEIALWTSGEPLEFDARVVEIYQPRLPAEASS